MICLTGPESAGKSTLAVQLAEALDAVVVPEAARSLLTAGQSYGANDLEEIAQLQQQWERAALADGALPIADTDITVIAIWWRVRFAAAADAPWPRWLDRLLQQRTPRYYLLCQPDLPWQPDPLRENPHDGAQLLPLYQRLLNSGPYAWQAISGQGDVRTRRAIAAARAGLAQLPGC